MSNNRSTRRLIALLATGLSLVVTLAFAIPAIVMLVQLIHGGQSATEHRETVIALSISGLATLLGLAGFIQWARVATGRKKIRWEWDSTRDESADE